MNTQNAVPNSQQRQITTAGNLGVMANTVSGFNTKPPGTANNLGGGYRQLTSSGGKLMHAQSNTMIKDKDNINNPQKQINDSSSIPYTGKDNAS